MERAQYADWKGQYRRDLNNGKAIIITNSENFNKKTMEGSDGSIFTKEFGPTINVEQNMREFSCFCGKTIGKYRQGKICPSCNEPVVQQFGANLLRSGWVDLGGFSVILPAAYSMIERVISPRNLQGILDYKADIGISGQLKETKHTSKTPYNNIGMMEFKRRFREIILFYAAIRKQDDRAKILLAQEDKIFTDVINIMAPEQRPAFVSQNSKDTKNNRLHFDEINRLYTSIISKAATLKRRAAQNNISVQSVLWSIQEELQALYTTIIKTKLSGKKGLTQSRLIGTRMSFSSRMVIVSHTNDKSRMDGIGMSYKAFITLHELELINCLKRGYGPESFTRMTVWEIIEYIHNSLASDKLDPVIYNLIQLMIHHKEGGIYCVVNRNPTIDIGSIQVARVVEVNPDPEDYTMSLFLSVLAPFTADFDGDVLNVFSLKEKCVKDAFNRAYNSRYLVLDRTGEDSYFNSDFSVYKDIMTNLFSFVAPGGQ